MFCQSISSVATVCYVLYALHSCLLITEEAEIVYDQSIAGISDFNRQRYENIALASLHGYVMFDLLDRDVFRRTSFINRQGKCQLAPYAPPVSRQTSVIQRVLDCLVLSVGMMSVTISLGHIATM